jgi:hypothetical protein
MRFGLRFCNVAAVREGCHGRYESLRNALASQKGQMFDANRSISMSDFSHVVASIKKLEDRPAGPSS